MKKITIKKIFAYFDYESVRLRILKKRRRWFAKFRYLKLKEHDFTIISNNCWGGMIYESYNLPKMSPTVGLFIMAEDYVKFLSDLKNYINCKLTFIPPEQSKYVNKLQGTNNFGKYPVGRLRDIEIMFLHYHSEEEALEKWERRCSRINWEKIIVKFNDQNGCEQKDTIAFSKLPFKHKLFFTIHNDWSVTDQNWCYVIKQRTKDSFLTSSHEPQVYDKKLNLTGLINSLGESVS